jgi:hypothetical protein
MAERASSDLAIFPAEDIKWAYTNYPHQTEQGRVEYPISPIAGHRYLQGVDLANLRDYFVSTVLDGTDQRLATQVRHDRFQKRGYVAYKGIIRANYSAYNSARTLVDATSLGESVVEDLRDIGAEGYKFTGSQAKYDVVHNLVRMLSEHRIAIPFVRELVDELRHFQYEITPSKNLKMEAKTGHDDYVISLALAAQLASTPLFTGFFLGGISTFQPKKAENPINFDPFANLDA